MRRILLISLFLISINIARDLSCRIRTLGDDFALLIPDYQTDVFYNPIFLNQNLFGVYYKTFEETPVKLNLLYRSVGFYGMYLPQYNEVDYNWRKRSIFNDRLKSILLYKIKRIGLSLTFDISRHREKLIVGGATMGLNSEQKFMFKSSLGFRLSNKLFLFIEPMFGFWEKSSVRGPYFQDTISSRNNLLIPSNKLNILYRNIKSNNRFISGYFEIGGPTSISELNGTPYPSLFINIFFANLGYSYAFPLNQNGMIVFGLREQCILSLDLAKEKLPTYIDTLLFSITNRISIPVALEYNINRISLRFGSKFYYNYYNLKRTESEWKYKYLSYGLYDEFGYDINCGFGFNPIKNVAIDFNIYDLVNPRDWTISLRYFF